MPNPLFNNGNFFNNTPQVNNNNNINNINLGNLKNIYSTFKNSNNNPMQMFMILAQQNPKMQPVVQMLQNGANPEQLVRSICQQRGIDVNQLLNQFR